MLSYYRNNLVHVFINHSEIACTLLGLGHQQDIHHGVPLNDLFDRVSFLQSFLSEEFVVKKVINTKEDFLKEVSFMAQRGHLNLNTEAGVVSINRDDSMQAYTQTYLCHLILPYIESYWITLVYFIENKKP